MSDEEKGDQLLEDIGRIADALQAIKAHIVSRQEKVVVIR
jgi:hypothetical protein